MLACTSIYEADFFSALETYFEAYSTAAFEVASGWQSVFTSHTSVVTAL
jgi:hypothetical protein